jgi:negative regulator of sigma E activity
MISASILMLAFSVVADDSGWQQFNRGQQAVKKFNFDVTYVQVKANQLQTYRWLHGYHQQNGALPVQTELEQLIPQDEVGTDIFRRNNRVYYTFPASPVFVTVNHSIKELPAILFQPPADLAGIYDAIPGSSTSLSGRTAQLLRLTALHNSRYSYWLWLDGETGFPLRVDTVDQNNEVLERWMVVHLQIKPTLPPELLPLMNADLPAEPVAVPSQQTASSAFRLNWLPDGYRLLPQLSPVPGRTGQLLASWLLTDGLHQISVFVQPSSGLAAQAFRDGATTLLVKPRDQIDVVVIGPLQATLASQLADAVQ